MSSIESADRERLLSRYEDSSASSPTYTPLAKSCTDCKAERVPHLGSLLRTALTMATCVMSVVAVILITHLRPSSSAAASQIHDHTGSWRDCGSSSEEARAKNCRFDAMLSSWLHADRLDAALHEQYLLEHNYTWYIEPALETTISDEVVRAGNHHRIYVEKEFHFVHCAYMWEMQMRAYRNGRAIDNTIWEYEHTEHCAKLLVGHVLPRNYTTLTVKFDSCGLPYGVE